MRRFILVRQEDVTGVSGTGIIAEGVQWSGGWVSLVWLTPYWSHVWYPSIEHVERIHGHGGQTVVDWLDAPLDSPYTSVANFTSAIIAYQRGIIDGTLPPKQVE